MARLPNRGGEVNLYAYNFVDQMVRKTPIRGSVLEVGSFNVNGSVRPLFADKSRFPTYVGIDIREGPEVDLVMDSHHLRYPSESWDIIVSCDTLEHDSRPWESLKEFHRVLRPNGWLVVVMSGIGFHEHHYPSDYWRATTNGLRELMKYGGFNVSNAQAIPTNLVCGLGRRNHG